ncbi:MAG: hypothetical protein ABIS21_03930, partial [Acidimicrobiales bacterium]
RYDQAANWTGKAMFIWGWRGGGQPPLNDGAVFARGPAPRPIKGGTGSPPAPNDPSREAKKAAAPPCMDGRGVAASAEDAERFVDGFVELRTLGAGAEECLSPLALKQYRPDGAAKRDPAATPPPLCLYDCGRAIVVEVRRAEDWLKGSANGTYTATVQVVLEQQTSSDDRTEYVIEEILTFGPGTTWSGRATRLVVQRVTTAVPGN